MSTPVEPMPPSRTSPPPAEASTTLDPATRRAIVEDVAKALRDGYVERDVGARAAEKIEQAHGAGAYDSYQRPTDFAVRLTADLYEVAHDKHLRVTALGAAPAAPPEPPPINDSGVVRADRLAGDIGYIEVVHFPPPEFSKAALDRAMMSLAGARALIVDMRRNGGGDPRGVAYLVSFVADGNTPVHVMDLLWRKPGSSDYRTDQTFTSVTPTTFVGKPVYVLTSAHTFSGGEEFCYDVKTMKLAVLVGETTGGGANPGRTRPLGAGLSMFLPAGKARSPITGANWEGVGVSPDIAVVNGLALKVALEELGQSPQQTEVGELSQESLFQMRDAALPGTEAALWRLIENAARGTPDYDQMTPEFADVVRQHSANLRPMIAALGPIQSIIFRGPGTGNGDRFEVRFADAAQLWAITLAADGKVALAGFFAA